ncbi:MAG: hypothetical protein ABR543_08145 [Gemmatimonadaceae bacterium]
MSIIPLFGHAALRRRLEDGFTRNALPASLLLEGPRGIGKQRLALWLGGMLLCTGDNPPCGRCQSCGYVAELAHPDLHWIFPRPRLSGDITAEDVRNDYRDAIMDRQAAAGLYPAPSGSEGIFIYTVHTLSGVAALTPAMGSRKVIVIGDAERMVPQEGSEDAANAFLKLLEEPPSNTHLILTSSEPGALLPTIRSRVVSMRASRLTDGEVRAFLEDPVVRSALDNTDSATSIEDRIHLASGAPGTLLADHREGDPMAMARTFVNAAFEGRPAQMRASLALGSSGARGFFSDVLDATCALLAQHARESADRNEPGRALAFAKAIDAAEMAKTRAYSNVNPQLVGTALLREMSSLLHD